MRMGANVQSLVVQCPCCCLGNSDLLARTLVNPSETEIFCTTGTDPGISSSCFLKAAAQQHVQNLEILITQQKLHMLEKHRAMLMSQPSQSMAAHIILDQQRVHTPSQLQKFVEIQSSNIHPRTHEDSLSHRDCSYNDYYRHVDVSHEQRISKESARTLADSQNNRLPPTVHRKKRIVSGKWENQYQNLVEYKAEHGDCIVPRGYLLNPKLASWVAEQRKQYKLFHRNQDTSMTQDRILLLDEIGFVWNAQEAAWEKKLNALASFYKKYRTWKVPIDHPTYQKLALWVKEQRRHRSLKKQGKSSHMTAERIHRLEAIGFRFDRNRAPQANQQDHGDRREQY